MKIGISSRLGAAAQAVVDSGGNVVFEDVAQGVKIVGPFLFGNLNWCVVIYSGEDRHRLAKLDRTGLLFTRGNATYANFSGFSGGGSDTVGTLVILQPNKVRPEKDDVRKRSPTASKSSMETLSGASNQDV